MRQGRMMLMHFKLMYRLVGQVGHTVSVSFVYLFVLYPALCLTEHSVRNHVSQCLAQRFNQLLSLHHS